MNEIKTKYFKIGMTDFKAKDLVFADTHERNVESGLTYSPLI